MKLSIPATEELFEHARHINSFDFIKQFINELNNARWKPGRFYEMEFWEGLRLKSDSIINKWNEEAEKILLNDDLPSQLYYQVYLESQTAKVLVSRSTRPDLEKQIDGYNKNFDSNPSFYLQNPLEGPIEELDTYFIFADRHYINLVGRINQVVGKLKVMTDHEIPPVSISDRTESGTNRAEGPLGPLVKLKWNGSKEELLNIFLIMAEENHKKFGKLIIDVSKQDIKEFIETYFTVHGNRPVRKKPLKDIHLNYRGDRGSLIRFFFYLMNQKPTNKAVPYIDHDLKALEMFLHQGFWVSDKTGIWKPLKRATIKKGITSTPSDFGSSATAIFKRETTYKNKSRGIIKHLISELDTKPENKSPRFSETLNNQF
jgi:hypothetical protein